MESKTVLFLTTLDWFKITNFFSTFFNYTLGNGSKGVLPHLTWSQFYRHLEDCLCVNSTLLIMLLHNLMSNSATGTQEGQDKGPNDKFRSKFCLKLTNLAFLRPGRRILQYIMKNYDQKCIFDKKSNCLVLVKMR